MRIVTSDMQALALTPCEPTGTNAAATATGERNEGVTEGKESVAEGEAAVPSRKVLKEALYRVLRCEGVLLRPWVCAR